MGQARTLLLTLATQPVKPVGISGERLIFTQPDIDASNFGVDEHGNTVLLDFGDIALLPESFVAYTMSSNKRLAAIAESSGSSASSNLASMAVISHRLWMTFDPRLGASTCT